MRNALTNGVLIAAIGQGCRTYHLANKLGHRIDYVRRQLRRLETEGHVRRNLQASAVNDIFWEVSPEVLPLAPGRNRAIKKPQMDKSSSRNEYENGFRAGLEMAIRVAQRETKTLENEYLTGANEAIDAIMKVLRDAK